MRTLVEESGSVPSPFEPELVESTLMFRTITLDEYSGWTTQYQAPSIVGPSIMKFLQPLHSTKVGRRPFCVCAVGTWSVAMLVAVGGPDVLRAATLPLSHALYTLLAAAAPPAFQLAGAPPPLLPRPGRIPRPW